MRQPYSMISITDSFSPEVKIIKDGYLRDLLRLEFMDLDLTRVNTKYWDQEYKTSGHSIGSFAMHHAHAEKIARFCRMTSVDCLVVHCKVGVSRSPSVAFAIADSLQIPRELISWPIGDVCYTPPNRHVYDLVMQAFKDFPERWEPQQERIKAKSN